MLEGCRKLTTDDDSFHVGFVAGEHTVLDAERGSAALLTSNRIIDAFLLQSLHGLLELGVDVDSDGINSVFPVGLGKHDYK